MHTHTHTHTHSLTHTQFEHPGDDSTAKSPPMSRAEEAKAREEEAAARSFQQYSQAAFVESSAWRTEQDLLKVDE